MDAPLPAVLSFSKPHDFAGLVRNSYLIEIPYGFQFVT